MSRKLTLTIDDHVVEFAKAYARKSHQSISSIVERYFSRLESEASLDTLTPVASELYGISEKNPLPGKRTMRATFHEKDPH